MTQDNAFGETPLYLPTTVGRELTGSPRKFTQWCVDNGVLYRKGRALKAKLRWENQGYLMYESTGDDDIFEQVYFTELGLAWITELYKAKGEDVA